MTLKLVIRKAKKKAALGASVVGRKRVTDADGNIKMVRTLDANTANFGAGLHLVFKQNVKKARSENKRLLGSSDVAPRGR